MTLNRDDIMKLAKCVSCELFNPYGSDCEQYGCVFWKELKKLEGGKQEQADAN